MLKGWLTKWGIDSLYSGSMLNASMKGVGGMAGPVECGGAVSKLSWGESKASPTQ